MKTEKAYFENGKGSANFSLLDPNGTGVSSNGRNVFLELSPAAAHDLGLEEIIAAFTADRGHPLEERAELGAGRFGEEAMRLGQIFEQVTRHSLVLLNNSVSGDSNVISVVSSPIDTAGQTTAAGVNRTYRLEIRPPLGQSYAREIAAQYGISYQQLENVLSERGVL